MCAQTVLEQDCLYPFWDSLMTLQGGTGFRVGDFDSRYNLTHLISVQELCIKGIRRFEDLKKINTRNSSWHQYKLLARLVLPIHFLGKQKLESLSHVFGLLSLEKLKNVTRD